MSCLNRGLQGVKEAVDSKRLSQKTRVWNGKWTMRLIAYNDVDGTNLKLLKCVLWWALCTAVSWIVLDDKFYTSRQIDCCLSVCLLLSLWTGHDTTVRCSRRLGVGSNFVTLCDDDDDDDDDLRHLLVRRLLLSSSYNSIEYVCSFKLLLKICSSNVQGTF